MPFQIDARMKDTETDNLVEVGSSVVRVSWMADIVLIRLIISLSDV